MSGPERRFHPSEIRPETGAGPSEADIDLATAMARDLEAMGARDLVVPTEGFEDRVMAAIVVEAPARLVVTSGRNLRGGLLAGFLVSFRDAWGVTTGSGRPFAVRAQAFGFVLAAVLALGSMTAVVGVGAAALLDSGPRPTPAPVVSPSPSPTQTPTTTPTQTATPSPSPSETADPTDTAEPTATDDHHETAEPTGTNDHHETTRPAKTPMPTETPEPNETDHPDGTDDHSGDDGGAGHG